MDNVNDKLVNKQSSEYGELYRLHLFEQYKMYVEMMDRISQRRLASNTFFITLNSSLLTIYSIFSTSSKYLGILVSLIGITITILWYSLIKSYKQLNTGKFTVIHEIEKCLPLDLYRYEWEVLGQGKDKRKYWPLSHIECCVPLTFTFIYIIILIIGCYPYFVLVITHMKNYLFNNNHRFNDYCQALCLFRLTE